jgi:protein-L-isoaspartate O-methyltransferase
MHAFHRIIVALACLSLALGLTAALASDGVMITVNNDSSDNLFVTVYDRNTSPPQQVLSHTALYGNASISVSIAADKSGHGRLSWTAITNDHDMRKCGHDQRRSNLNEGDTVNVHADGDCAQ